MKIYTVSFFGHLLNPSFSSSSYGGRGGACSSRVKRDNNFCKYSHAQASTVGEDIILPKFFLI